MWNWLKKLFGVCQHDWQEYASTCVPPEIYLSRTHNIHRKHLMKLVTGYSTILFKCRLCSKHKTIEILGIRQAPAKLGTLHAIKKESQ